MLLFLTLNYTVIKNLNLPIILFFVMLLNSCAKNIYITYQAEGANTGIVILKPAKPTSRTFVTINDNLLIDKKSIKSVTVKNVPAGEYSIHYSSDNSWYKDKMDVQINTEIEPGKEVTKIIEVPPYSTGYWIYISGLAILPWLILFTF